MGCRQKLLLSFMIGELVLFYGIDVTAALTSQEIAKTTLGSTVHLGLIDAKGNSWTGSGFVIRDGQIATNHHVIDNMSIGGARLVGQEDVYLVKAILAVDKERDLAIVKVTGLDVPPLPLGDSDVVQIGDKVYVAGNPRGLEGTFTGGMISAIRPEGIPLVRGKILQMDAAISPGSSGGPVLNDRGEVIGISVGHRVGGQNLNFAIPVNYLKLLANIPITPTPVKPKQAQPKVDPPPVESKPVKPQAEPPPAEPKQITPKVDSSPVEPKQVRPKVDPPPAKPKQVTPKVDSSPVEPKPNKPKVNSPPVEPKPTKPQADPPHAEPKHVKPQIDPPQLEPSKPHPRPDTLEKGIKLYEQAKYNEAIKVLSSAIRELEDPEQRARAYLYLGASKRGSGEGNDKVKEQFQESIRHNPNQELPPRVGKDHPIFAELLEEVRKELTGELTVISLLPQTEIWIFGTGTDRKMLGTGIVSSRLLRGNYIVEGIYAGESRRKTITIEPDRHEVLDLGIPPIMEHESPSRISAGERIPLTLNLISSKGPQQVKIYYKIYDKDSDELAQNSQEMGLWDQQSASSTWAYKVGLSSQKHVGLIEYYIEVEYDNHVVFRQPRTQNRYYQISIVDDKPPAISLLDPPEGAKFGANQQITIRAEVTDNIAVKDVHIHASSFNSQESQKLAADGPSDIYTIDITASNIVVLWYYLTATDEEGNENRSESRHLEIKPGEKPPEIKTPIASDGNKSNSGQQKNPPEEEPPEEEPPEDPPPPPPPFPLPPPPPPPRIYQGVWVSVSADDASTFDWDGSYMFRLAYLSEGKNQSTLGAQLNFSYPDRTNLSAMFQWGPALENSNIAFTLLGGIAEYEDSPATKTSVRSTHTTPIFGGVVKFYPRDKIVIDATSSIKFRSDYDMTDLYHYEIGARFYITRELNLRIGYGKLYLGNRDLTTIQVGLGYTF